MSPYDARTERFFADAPERPDSDSNAIRIRRNAGAAWPEIAPGETFVIYDQEQTELWRGQVSADRRDRTELLLLGACLLTLVAGLCAWKPWLREPVLSSVAFVAIIAGALWARQKLDEFGERRPDLRLVDALRRLGL